MKLRGDPIWRVKVRSTKGPLVAFCVGMSTAINASGIRTKVFLESVDAKSRLIRHPAQRPNFKAQSYREDHLSPSRPGPLSIEGKRDFLAVLTKWIPCGIGPYVSTIAASGHNRS